MHVGGGGVTGIGAGAGAGLGLAGGAGAGEGLGADGELGLGVSATVVGVVVVGNAPAIQVDFGALADASGHDSTTLIVCFSCNFLSICHSSSALQLG